MRLLCVRARLPVLRVTGELGKKLGLIAAEHCDVGSQNFFAEDASCRHRQHRQVRER